MEVAFYPQKDKPVDVLLDDFTLKPEGTDISARPMSPQVVAARLDTKPGSTSTVSTTQSVGYESGTYIDPVTGRPVKYHGVTTETGVGVGVDPSGSSGGADRDRVGIEAELAEKGLPEGSAAKAVAGYLYFPASIREKKEDPDGTDVQTQRSDRRFFSAINSGKIAEIPAVSIAPCVDPVF